MRISFPKILLHTLVCTVINLFTVDLSTILGKLSGGIKTLACEVAPKSESSYKHCEIRLSITVTVVTCMMGILLLQPLIITSRVLDCLSNCLKLFHEGGQYPPKWLILALVRKAQ